MESGDFSEDSLEGDYLSQDDDGTSDVEDSEGEEHEMMLDDLRAVWEQHKTGGDLSDVLDHMVEVSSRPGTGYYSRPATGARPHTGRLGPPQPLSPGPPTPSIGQGQMDVSFMEDINDVLAVRPATSTGRPPTSDTRPVSSLGRIANQNTLTERRVPTAGISRLDSAQFRPKTPFDSDARVDAMAKVSVTTRVVESRAYTPRPGSAVRMITPRGINALFNKRVDSASRPSTPFTSEEPEEIVAARPFSGGGNRIRDVGTAGGDLAAVQEEVLDTDDLPDAKGTESHRAGVDVWIRDDEGGEDLAGGEDMWPQPESPARSPAQHADTQPVTPRNSTGERVVPTAEPGGGSCSVANSALVDWMNDTASEAPAPVPEPEPIGSDEDEDNSCQFANEAARQLLLGPAAPRSRPSSSKTQERLPSRGGNTSSRESKRPHSRRDSQTTQPLQLDCTPKPASASGSRESTREGTREGTRAAAIDGTTSALRSGEGAARPASKAPSQPESREPQESIGAMEDRLFGGSDAQNRMRVTREIAAYNAQTPKREKTPSVTLAGRDIGGEIKVRAQEVEAQEKAARRERELVSSRLLSTNS